MSNFNWISWIIILAVSFQTAVVADRLARAMSRKPRNGPAVFLLGFVGCAICAYRAKEALGNEPAALLFVIGITEIAILLTAVAIRNLLPGSLAGTEEDTDLCGDRSSDPDLQKARAALEAASEFISFDKWAQVTNTARAITECDVPILLRVRGERLHLRDLEGAATVQARIDKSICALVSLSTIARDEPTRNSLNWAISHASAILGEARRINNEIIQDFESESQPA